MPKGKAPKQDITAQLESGKLIPLMVRLTVPAVNRACELVEMLGAGEVIDGIIDVDNSDPNHKRLPFEPDKMNALLGLELSAEEQKKLLEKQKEGKKRMKAIGSVEVPQEAFMAILKVDE